MTRRQAATIAAFCLSSAAGVALLAAVQEHGWPAIAVWLEVLGKVASQ